MIFLVPHKAFKKKIEKWVLPKDFVIVNALDRQDGSMSQYGNTILADELAPTPALIKIAMDPDSEEAKIKKRHIKQYLDKWLEDQSVITKAYHLVNTLVESYKLGGEDVNIFIVMRSRMFYAYHEAMEEKLNEDYGVKVFRYLTHKMSKKEVKELLTTNLTKEEVKLLKERLKAIRKTYDISKTPTIDLD